jgi:hypothetical protein
MKCKFEFKPVEKTFSDPVASIFKPGIPFGREYTRGDIVLLHPEITSSKIFLNSKVLRDAILDSKEYLEEALGIKFIDKYEPPKTNTKAPKKSKVVDVPDAIVGNVEGLAIEESEETEEPVNELTILD